MTILAASILALAVGSQAHQVAWSKGMYCKNSNSNVDSPNAAGFIIDPLYNLTTTDWFLHGVCRNFPPPAGEYLNVPANGKFTVEIASNRAFTTMSYNGTKATDWPDGKVHPNNWSTNVSDPNFPPSSVGCLGSPNIHAHGSVDAAGTAFAISYNNNINTVAMTDFTVFTVLANTPYKRLATYSVPNLPACPSGGCLCAWAWVPNGCGQSNIYMNAYRCQVTGASKTALPVGKPQVPVWCQTNQSACLKGPKQMIVQWQAQGNNVVLPSGMQQGGGWPSPNYNSKVGFTAGAQTDIFVSTTVKSTATSSASSAKITSSASTTTTASAVNAAITTGAEASNSLSAETATGTVVSEPSDTVVPSSAPPRDTMIPVMLTITAIFILSSFM
ncbi:hypothetical protein EXIGLDRAFT_678929 [Exidia glandulosa HHB12029]|uniref:Uncharacterized protein n=1 Tax=Exidia glandulosa HHB12029 TaxID=1314781 RepID=A0A165F609_EXIGL|nr:hypothetical protein EXIGLDRAFT_678929 [Exidia glandulosa HHB12029]